MREFEYNGEKYSYIPFKELQQDKDLLPEFVPYRESGYINVGAAFDIETTSYLSKKYKKALKKS